MSFLRRSVEPLVNDWKYLVLLYVLGSLTLGMIGYFLHQKGYSAYSVVWLLALLVIPFHLLVYEIRESYRRVMEHQVGDRLISATAFQSAGWPEKALKEHRASLAHARGRLATSLALVAAASAGLLGLAARDLSPRWTAFVGGIVAALSGLFVARSSYEPFLQSVAREIRVKDLFTTEALVLVAKQDIEKDFFTTETLVQVVAREREIASGKGISVRNPQELRTLGGMH